MAGVTESAKKIVKSPASLLFLGADPSTATTVKGASAGAEAVAKHYAPDMPDIPSVTAPTPMPIPGQDTLEAIRARRSSIQAQLARRGRLSTILSSPSFEPLGG